MTKRLRNQRGEGLISVLISIAILGILIVTMVTLYQLFGTMMAKSLLRREADLLANRLRGVLLQKTMCEQAFGTTQTWDGNAETDVTLNVGGVIYGNNFPLANGRLIIQRLFVRKKYITNSLSLQTAPNVASPVRINGLNYNSYAGEVVIRFGLASDMTNTGLLTDRVVPVLLAVTQAAPFTITSCDVNDESSMAWSCDMAKAAGGEWPCPATPTHADCVNIFYVKRINAMNEPVCACQESCPQPVWRGQNWTGNCVALAAVQPPNIACPLGPGGAPKTNPPNTCYGWEGVVCQWKDFGLPCAGPTPYAVWRAECKIDFTN